MRYRLPTLALGALLALGCEGALVIDPPGGGGGGGGGGGPGGPVIHYDAGPGVWLDGGARWDGGPGAVPGCSLPAEGLCDGAIARWCDGANELYTDCGAFGQTCTTTGGRATCAPAGDPGTNPDPGTDPGPTAPTGCAGPEEQQVIDLANGERSSTLTCDPDMARAARLHSQDMCERGYFSHTSLDGRSPFQRMEDEGVTYRTAGENIAYGQPTPQAVHTAWMNSSGHRANILNGSFGRIGVGYWDCDGTAYWTQNFAD